MSTAKIDEMYEESRRLGALGGKISGAGGGGFLLLYCPFDRKPAVGERLRAMGGEVYPVAFEDEGMQSWTSERTSNPLTPVGCASVPTTEPKATPVR